MRKQKTKMSIIFLSLGTQVTGEMVLRGKKSEAKGPVLNSFGAGDNDLNRVSL